MDNQNNQSSSNNLNNPSDPAPLWPSSPVQPPPSPASSDPGNPISPFSPQTSMESVPADEPAAMSAAPPTPMPDTTEPAAPLPSDTAFSQNQTSTWTPPVQPTTPQPDPLTPSVTPNWSSPTSTLPPQPQPAPYQDNTEPKPGMSALDNPWGAPSQPPAIDGSASIQPNWTSPGQNPAPGENANTPSSLPIEAAPTDLSHLISNNNSSQVTTQAAPETLVAPSAPTPEVPTLPAQNHKAIPRWLIGLGAGLLILVIGASVYFILGIGQGAKTTTSLPATIAPKTNEVVPSREAAAPVAQPSSAPAATGSASFGQLEGSSGNTPATSAAELLRQRQQTGK